MLKYNSFRIGLGLLIGAVALGGLLPIVFGMLDPSLNPLTFAGNSVYVLVQPAAIVGALLIAASVVIDYLATGGIARRAEPEDDDYDDQFDDRADGE